MKMGFGGYSWWMLMVMLGLFGLRIEIGVLRGLRRGKREKGKERGRERRV